MNQGEMILTPEDAALLLHILENRCEYGPEVYPMFDRLEECAALVPPPLNGDTVWSGLTTGLANNGTQHNQCSTVVRAKSKAAAVRLLTAAGEYISASHFTHYWGKTGNHEQLAIATEPGVWVKGSGGWIKK